MAWETVLYAHPQGARLTRVMLTRKDADAEITADVYWHSTPSRERSPPRR